jgi:membrane-associated protease RseP (regulator of RpoE activity)
MIETSSNISQTDHYTPTVQRFMRIEKVIWGGEKSGFLVRYQGKLLGDSQEIYDQMAASFQHQSVTPLFRIEEGQHAVILVNGVIHPKPANPWINLFLFLLTLFSVLFAGSLYNYTGPASENTLEAIWLILKNIGNGWPFAVSMLAILLAHEFGHYLAARYHKTAVTLPYFLPFPFSPFGTMGAFIQLQQPPKNKNVLHDIGIAGPLAGLVVAIPVLLFGLLTSEINRLPGVLPAGQGFEGNSILYLLMKFAVYGQWLPQPIHYAGVSPALYWIQYFFTGFPLPSGGLDVTLNAVAWAGWAGLLVTALNLIPAGQLDGGHLMYVLLEKNVRKLLPLIFVVLMGLGFAWSGWWFWAFLLFLLGRNHAEPLDQITPLDPRRKAVAIFGLIIAALVFTPVPLISVIGG